MDDKRDRTKERDVLGMTGDYREDKPLRIRPKTITVRVTRDEKGASISLADELRGIMLLVPAEPIMDMIDFMIGGKK